eukprot:8932698-Ditylum_brightwellii.AAC.1
MEWKDEIITFSDYAKPNHTIKCVRSTSCRHPVVFKAIPAGVFAQLGRPTYITMDNINCPINELYSAHMSALRSARIFPIKSLLRKNYRKRRF